MIPTLRNKPKWIHITILLIVIVFGAVQCNKGTDEHEHEFTKHQHKNYVPKHEHDVPKCEHKCETPKRESPTFSHGHTFEISKTEKCTDRRYDGKHLMTYRRYIYTLRCTECGWLEEQKIERGDDK